MKILQSIEFKDLNDQNAKVKEGVDSQFNAWMVENSFKDEPILPEDIEKRLYQRQPFYSTLLVFYWVDVPTPEPSND